MNQNIMGTADLWAAYQSHYHPFQSERRSPSLRTTKLQIQIRNQNQSSTTYRPTSKTTRKSISAHQSLKSFHKKQLRSSRDQSSIQLTHQVAFQTPTAMRQITNTWRNANKKLNQKYWIQVKPQEHLAMAKAHTIRFKVTRPSRAKEPICPHLL